MRWLTHGIFTGNERADAYDGVIDVLREPVAEDLTDVRIRLARQGRWRGRKPAL